MVKAAATAIKPINDDYLLTVPVVLPQGFGYVLAELNMSVVVDTAVDFQGNAVWRVSNAAQATQGFSYRYALSFQQISINGSTIGARTTRYEAGQLSRVPILPQIAGAVQSLSCSNLSDPAMAAGTCDALVSFWEYDLQQLQYYFVHSAMNVVGR